ncbi:protein phosphatase 1F isoform X2 [Mobula birostris]|uniref:protein phosphatase 1F isoform X2 n=1 Tax=Mobula birostris TaxID=1983395 RepID=UPI003B2812EF
MCGAASARGSEARGLAVSPALVAAGNEGRMSASAGKSEPWMEIEIRQVLDSLLREFPSPLGPEDPLPMQLESALLSWEEVEGESVDMGLKLLQDRNLPPVFAAALMHTAITHMQQLDISVLTNKKEPDENEEQLVLLDGELVARTVFNKLLEVCCDWIKEPQLLQVPKRYLKVSSHAIRNTRRKMEDRHVALPEFNALFGIEKLRSGTTGVTALIAGNTLHVAWLGDSQVMMVRQGQVVTLMDPHKPEKEDEKQRIEELGGCVIFLGCWRVNGTLAVSRAIGDIEQKPYISGDADCSTFELDGREDYIILACDGFFDGVEPSKVVHLVQEHLQKNAGDGSSVAETLVTAAKEGGSSDNITVVLVFLRDPQIILKDSQSKAGNENAGLDNKCSEAKGRSEAIPPQSSEDKDNQTKDVAC